MCAPYCHALHLHECLLQPMSCVAVWFCSPYLCGGCTARWYNHCSAVPHSTLCDCDLQISPTTPLTNTTCHHQAPTMHVVVLQYPMWVVLCQSWVTFIMWTHSTMCSKPTTLHPTSHIQHQQWSPTSVALRHGHELKSLDTHACHGTSMTTTLQQATLSISLLWDSNPRPPAY